MCGHDLQVSCILMDETSQLAKSLSRLASMLGFCMWPIDPVCKVHEKTAELDIQYQIY
jgi:hypothetical protein